MRLIMADRSPADAPHFFAWMSAPQLDYWTSHPWVASLTVVDVDFDVPDCESHFVRFEFSEAATEYTEIDQTAGKPTRPSDLTAFGEGEVTHGFWIACPGAEYVEILSFRASRSMPEGTWQASLWFYLQSPVLH